MLRPAPENTVLFTVDDLEKMIEAGIFAHHTGKIELIEGEFYKLSPASELHDTLIRLLTTWSVKQQTEERFEVGVQLGMRLNKTQSMPEPDIFWVKAGQTRRPTTAVVPLVIEVSVSTIKHDRDTKCRLYALDGLQEYWIVNADGQCVEVYREPEDEQFRESLVWSREAKISPLCLPTAQLEVDWLFRSAGV